MQRVSETENDVSQWPKKSAQRLAPLAEMISWLFCSYTCSSSVLTNVHYTGNLVDVGAWLFYFM